ncbi:BZ3500_MvSof-1268-A1-R1_Chr7-1g09229 [Microbotryum saponariae]|uniref:glycogenin glucosyltransferase n=1 Tax=Microbotryum saponariae TaxID=289078 RepID=A0A2X0MVZ7_9BASI|nr:BZ3501_MvSof-1269-A2-R1_Chr7-1g08934 [Microbotryum saponariae]SDA03038.1 BZ3500_MvSof-1268-A1-R1_Chr7-1g09229 [Microbotryum saponariae]
MTAPRSTMGLTTGTGTDQVSKAFVTLLTSDSYLPGCLTMINSLLNVEGAKGRADYETVCLVTPATVGHVAIKALHKVFDQVIGVAEITTRSWHELALLGELLLSLLLLSHRQGYSARPRMSALDPDPNARGPCEPIAMPQPAAELESRIRSLRDTGFLRTADWRRHALNPNSVPPRSLKHVIVRMTLYRSYAEGRKDLAASLTKLHLWRLTKYNKIVFLDADTLILRPLTPLFDLDVEFAAAPDSGWPDSFNSGVFLAKPSSATFDSLIEMMDHKGTWDGGDQGLLNDHFPNWYRLKYTYNVTPSAYYTYALAFRRHGHDVSVLHFIGKNKPWHRGTRGTAMLEESTTDYYNLVGLWYDVYERHYGRSLTSDVADKVVAPPAFQSKFSMLQPHQPTPASTKKLVASTSRSGIDSPPKLDWDPAVNPPPTTDYQMREAITARYDSVWDEPARKQKIRFQPPSSYPNVPPSTHEWYKDVMQKKPDPSAVKPVFPWEQPKVSTRPSQPPSPVRAPTRAFPPTPSGSPPREAPNGFQPRQSYTNAWDNVPGIDRYAKSLAKATKRREISIDATKDAKGSTGSAIFGSGSGPRSGSSDSSTKGDNGLGGRQSSLAELKPYNSRSDASSRDGDDEDDDDDEMTSGNDDEEVDRPRINYRRSSSYGSSSWGQSGASSPTTARSGSTLLGSGETAPSAAMSTSASANSPPKTKRFVPLMPRLGRAASSEVPVHHQPAHQSAAPLKSALRGGHSTGHSAPSASGGIPYVPAPSPRLGPQAIRNSTAARLTSAGSGVGDGPPVVRATRVFSPETDTGVVKQQRLAALQRFVENFEATNGNGSAAGGPRGGGAGSAGTWRFG